MKILIVEDDASVAQALKLLLSNYRYAVDIAVDGNAGLEMAEAFEYDLILLDILLPGLDGISLCERLRAKDFQMPILLLTGHEGEARQKAIALNAGADDYVVKPFDAEELIARVQALLRRGDLAAQPILTWGDLNVDPSGCRVMYGAQSLNLTPKEYAILELLLRHPYQIWSHSAMLNQVWQSAESPGDEAIRVHIKELRKKLKAAGAPKDLIETVYRVGYRLNTKYAAADHALPESSLTDSVKANSVSEAIALQRSETPLETTQANSQRQIQDLERQHEKDQSAQQQLQNANDELELRVAERTAKLEAANRQLRQREQQWQALFEYALDAIAIADDEGCYVDANPAACELFGVAKDALLGRSVADFTAPDLEFAQVWQQFLQQGQLSGEFRIYRPDGTMRETEFSAVSNFVPGRHLSILRDVSDRKSAEISLQQQIQREQAIAEISQDIRRSLSLENVLTRTVERIRELLHTDRVIIFRFRSDWRGDVIMESVGAEWMSILSTTVSDPCFTERFIEPYRQGRVCRLNDVEGADLEPCYVEFQRQLQVKANLVVPILQADNLWGLLIAHQCSAARQWQDFEVELLQRLATQVGIAIQQSELYERTRRELVERQQMQAVLEASEERFRQLSAEAPIGICQTDPNGICLYVNARWQEMSGLSSEDCLGVGWLQAVHPEDREAVFMAWQRCIQQEDRRLPECRLLTPQREVRWISARVATMTAGNGDVIGYVNTFEDITERKLAEQTIREQAALLDITTDAIFVRDLDHRILYWNRGAERLYGWQSAEAIGQIAHELLQNDVSQLSDIMQTLLEQGEWRGEIHKVTRGGEPVVVEGRWTLMRDDVDKPQFILAVDTDITAKKQLEARFYQAQRLDSLGRLASGIAHDLNNVLTPILTIAQLLRLTQRSLDDRAQERLRLLEDSAKRGAGMVKQILTFTRGSQGEHTTVDLAALLQEVMGIAQQSFPKSIDLFLDLPDTQRTDQALSLVHAVPTQLHQVFMNLCINARDAMPQGGRLTLTAKNVTVDEATAAMNWDVQAGNYVVMTVADTGTGMTPEVRDRMFEPFFTTKPTGQGTGLGLATVLGIVKSHGGFLDVVSEVGRGTQIKVYFPAQARKPSEQELTEQRLEGQGERILIVDDEEAVQRCTQALLESHQYITFLADDGLAALELYTQYQKDIDLVIVDITMPNMGGIELIQHLRAINPLVKTIGTSGLSENREPVLAAGANSFVAKPYTLETLLKTVLEVVSNRT